MRMPLPDLAGNVTWREQCRLPHSAGIRGVGRTPAEAFAKAALVLTSLVTDPATVMPRFETRIECEAPDLHLLFVEWIKALAREMTSRQLLFSEFEVHFDRGRLQACVRGEPLDVARHRPAVTLHGSTLLAPAVGWDDGYWYAHCVIATLHRDFFALEH